MSNRNTPLRTVLLYGAYGYTGELVAREAVARGHRPILAGRRRERLEPLAQELELPYRVVGLEDAHRLEEAVGEAAVVLHCAGPFSRTAAPMIDACLAARRHYLDITGEAEVFLAARSRDGEARGRGVLLLPGVGFDVVPTDCLARGLAERMPEAARLELAFAGDSGPSHGTALTMIEHLHEGGLVRRGGELKRVPLGWKVREVDFGEGPVSAVSIPWGDVVTSWTSTGIPDATVYLAAPPAAIRRLRRLRWVRPLLGLGPVRALLRKRVEARPAGPSARRLATGTTRVWGRVEDAAGRAVEGRLKGPQAYRWTVLTALAAAERVLEGDAPSGYHTPATAWGAGFVDEATPGLERP